MWSLFGLHEELSEILSHNTQDEELYASNEKNTDEDRGPTGYRHLREQVDEYSIKTVRECQAASDESHDCRDVQRLHTEGSNTVQGETEHLSYRVLGFTMQSGFRFIADGQLSESQPGNEPANELGIFRQ